MNTQARHTVGQEDAKTFLIAWLHEIDYEKHLYDSEDSEKVAASRWTNVLDFVDWVAKRCGGEITQDGGSTYESARQSVLDVAQTISVILSLAERGDDQDQVTLTTLHASKGLEWPHVVLAGVNEGILPFKSEAEDMTAERLEEERRLMYVGQGQVAGVGHGVLHGLLPCGKRVVEVLTRRIRLRSDIRP